MATEKMGFETTKTTTQSYGRSGTIVIDGISYHCASEAEALWLQIVAPGLRSGDIRQLDWQPGSISLTYKYSKQECKDTYRPDAHIYWANGDDWWVEIKRGRLDQKSANKLKRACQQYPTMQFVLCWMGRLPKKGVIRRRIERLVPHLHHMWVFNGKSSASILKRQRSI